MYILYSKCCFSIVQKSTYKNITGKSLTHCDPNEPTAGLLCNPPGLLKSDGKVNSIEGNPYITIDLEVLISLRLF